MSEITALLFTALAERYRVERQLGEGGMATVYLAEDLKHDRKVALKVLRPELGVVLGADRFLQEIKTTARLQHPNILPLYDSGSTTTVNGATGLLYYVMPYIEGETLRTKLEREQQLGIDEAVRIAIEVADALQHAHEQGVVHRDIKPENILLRNGRAFVADFGIALAVSAAAGGRMTETGLSLGTPHYMSPEQATADRHVTNRSDIYALGSVLYEMLTGEPPHTGPSAQAVVLKIVADAARPVQELRKAVPAHVAAAVAMALEKIPADRFESAQAFATALRTPGFTAPLTTAAAQAAAPRAARGGMRRAVLPMLAGALFAAALTAWVLLRGREPATEAVARYPTTLEGSGTLDGITFAVDATLSPDGSLLVFRRPLIGPGQLYVKRRDEVTARPLAGTDGASGPFFSPDGAWIGFVANGQLRRVPTAGGASLTLADSINPLYNRGAWLEDGSIVMYDATSRTLQKLAAGDAKPKVVVSRAMLEGRFPWLPSPLPSSRGVLFTAHQTNCVGPVSCRPSRVYVYDAQRDSIRVLFEDAIGAWHVPTGHVLYLTSGGTLMAARWDNDALVTTSRPVAVLGGIQAPGFHLAADGTAYYVQGRSEFSPAPVPNATVVWVDRAGRVTPVDSSWQVNTGGSYNGNDEELDWGLALSPDGRRIALTMLTEVGTDIWLKPLPAGPATRLTMHRGVDRAPSWTRDGRAVTYLSDRPMPGAAAGERSRFALWEQPADGVSDPQLLWRGDRLTAGARSGDGRWLILERGDSAGTGAAILAAQPGIDSMARALVAAGVTASGAALSPDARWLAYVSDEQGTHEVFVRPFPNVNGGKWQVSSGGGSAPVWARSGRELFYASKGAMYTVPVTTGASFSAASPRMLFAIPRGVRAESVAGGTFAVSPDDQRFLMVQDHRWEDMAGVTTLVVVQNFLGELLAKLK